MTYDSSDYLIPRESTKPPCKIMKLGMLERLEILKHAEEVFKKGFKTLEGMEKKDRKYILGLGKEGEDLFYEQIRGLDSSKKNPSIHKKGTHGVGHYPKSTRE